MSGPRAKRISRLLTVAFAPEQLEIIDESARHAGHTHRLGGNEPGGSRQEGETHLRLRMVSARFAGMPRLARSRAVHAALAEEFATGLHALSLELRAPGEA